ncbi:COG3904 family protein [Pacificibacter marinus]|uniref:Uncharacterized protein n=1 Tax=Pacificibacter marinus TaxID=658057 RepID=A0A1Y5RW73_9RHOB|nr:hypothetical protein [Pacificibacter marinus]SEK36859.1 hypothetical protein SAMN04488032_10276 [Pacificibacter marinus]SLN26491.1 hypothetical protein PAM7971_01012 [Pacificibacter marinus]
MTGAISAGDAERFETFLNAEGTDFGTVRLNSPGGSVSGALLISQRLRQENLDTVLGAGNICLSASPYIFASGVARTVDIDAQVGVHEHFFDVNAVMPAFLAVEDIHRGQGAVMAYLNEMAIDPPSELSDYQLIFTPDAAIE